MADWINLLANGTRPDQVGGAFQAGFDDARQRQQAAQDRQFKLQAQQQAITSQAAARTGIAAALSTGNYDAAAAQAALYGDDKSATVLAGIGKDHLDRAGKNTTALANISNSVLALPYEQRAAAIQSAKPLLVAQGLDPHAIDQFDPTDNNIRSLGHVDYSYGQGVKDAIEQQTADTGSYNAQTNRLTATQPVVMSQGQSMVGRDGNLVYQAPQTITAPMGDNVIQMPGTVGSAPITQQQAWANMIRAEGGTNRDGSFRTSPAGAVGPAQVMPGTAPEAAKLAGLPWDAARYASDPQYNLALGQAYHNSLVQRYGGDIAKSAAAYNAGPGRVDRAVAQATKAGDPSKWANYLPGETQGYLQKVMGPGSRAVAAPITIQTGKDTKAATATAANTDQRAIDATDQAIRSANDLLNHPGLNAAVGSGFDPASYGSINPLTGQPFAGTNAANFRARLDTLKAQTFLPQVQALRGLGALSDAEGKKLSDAVGALDPNMSETEFRSSLTTVITDLKAARARAQQRMVAGARSPDGSSTTSNGSIPPAAEQYLRAHPETRGHFDRTFGAGASASVLGS